MAALFVSMFAYGQQSYKIHILEEGETLSGLMFKENYRPLYVKEKWVERALQLNHLTPEMAKDLKTGTPVILPTKESVLGEHDYVSTRQSSLSHGLLGNKLSKHQKIELGFQYYLNKLSSVDTELNSRENFGVFVGYIDQNNRDWSGFQLTPEFQFGVITHGTNRTSKDSSISYEPTIELNTKIALRLPASSISFGPIINWQSASRGQDRNGELKIRRDHTLWTGGYIATTFESPGNTWFELQANAQRGIFNQEIHGYENLDLLKVGLSVEANLTKNYFFKLFSEVETFDNNEAGNAMASGASLTYNLE